MKRVGCGGCRYPQQHRRWALADSIEAAVEGADAALILTEWRQYRDLNWGDLASRTRKPAWAFDARAVTKSEQVQTAGLRLWRVGDGANQP